MLFLLVAHSNVRLQIYGLKGGLKLFQFRKSSNTIFFFLIFRVHLKPLNMVLWPLKHVITKIKYENLYLSFCVASLEAAKRRVHCAVISWALSERF